MNTSEIILDTLLFTIILGIIFAIILINNDDDEIIIFRSTLIIVLTILTFIIAYDIGYYNSKIDLYYKIDKNISIKNTIDFKEYKLRIEKEIKDSDKRK